MLTLASPWYAFIFIINFLIKNKIMHTGIFGGNNAIYFTIQNAKLAIPTVSNFKF